MKKHLSLLLFAIVAGTTMLFASEGKEVTIDGLRYNLDEQNQTAEVVGMSSNFVQDKIITKWDQFPAEYVFEAKLPQNAAYSGLKSVKVYADKTYINLLVEPDMEYITDLSYVPFHVFLNTDNSDATGGYSDEFVDANSDIMLEGGFYYENEIISYTPYVFKWWGEVGGYGWEWVDPNVEHSADDCWGAIICEGQLEDCTSQYIDGKFEIKINRRNIPATWNDSEFGIGFDIQQSWESVGLLPLGSPTEVDLRGLTHKLQVKIDNRESEPAQPITDLIIPETVSYDGKDYSVTSIGGNYIEHFEGYSQYSCCTAFYGCKNLTSVIIPNTVTSIGNQAFCGCSSLTSVILPNSVTSIGEGVFERCTCLTSPVYNAHIFAYLPTSYSGAYSIPQGIETIAGAAFYECTDLTSVKIPNSVTSIGNNAFFGCTGLTSVTIPNSVTSIGYGAFGACLSLTAVSIPSSVTSIERYAFTACSSLTTISVASGNKVYDSRENCNAIIETATNTLVCGCNTSIIPNSVTTIGEGAFVYCNPKNIVLGSSVETIKSAAFAPYTLIKNENGLTTLTDDNGNPVCTLESITCYSVRPPSVISETDYQSGIISSFIMPLPLSTIIYAPVDNVNDYLAHEFWGRYDVRAFEAESAETDEVKVEPTTNSVEVVWPAVEGAETYELVIKDKQGNVICTLIFNANGQLTSIIFSAPARDNATEQTQSAGFAFTVTGLQSGTTYDLTITAKDSNDQILQTTSQTFTTAGLTGVEDVVTNTTPTKLILGGQILILRGDKTYTVQGQEVR